MAFRTITARFPGTCRRCKGPINVGERIRHGGKGLTYHLSSQCPGKASEDSGESRDGGEYRTCSQGGRCEDFPCCGCYGLHGRELYTPSEPPDYDDYDGRY